MGPRLISRGVVFRLVLVQLPLSLQWGRGSLAAAWTTLGYTVSRSLVLQWGRGSLAAACAPMRSDSAASKASMGPRLISRGVADLAAIVGGFNLLQWGRGSLAAACSGTIPHSSTAWSFNGAAAH